MGFYLGVVIWELSMLIVFVWINTFYLWTVAFLSPQSLSYDDFFVNFSISS
jgi:hypothetical protein